MTKRTKIGKKTKRTSKSRLDDLELSLWHESLRLEALREKRGQVGQV